MSGFLSIIRYASNKLDLIQSAFKNDSFMQNQGSTHYLLTIDIRLDLAWNELKYNIYLTFLII